MEAFVLLFFQQCFLAVVATLIGWFLPGRPTSRKATGKEIGLLFLKTWVFVYIITLVSMAMLSFLQSKPENIQSLGQFLIPLIAGAWFAKVRTRQLLLSSN